MVKPDLTKPIEQQTAAVLRRMLAYGEARGEGPLGMLAVVWVAENRAKRAGSSVKDEILKPWQFSSFNADDPNRVKLVTALLRAPVSWAVADAVCTLLEQGHANPDPSCGATHYCTTALWGSDSPKWFGKAEIDAGRTRQLVVLGNHVFAKAT
jgi:N-acetylmuramoyl-L-alanine amidase